MKTETEINDQIERLGKVYGSPECILALRMRALDSSLALTWVLDGYSGQDWTPADACEKILRGEQ